MKVATQIRKSIAKIPKGKTFGYADLPINKDEFQSAAKALERLQAAGVIKKMSKGIFYKPEMTVFGELLPDENERLKPYLYKDGKRIAYITGEYLYNRMHLTTQMAFRIKIASNKRINIDKGAIKATSVKSYVNVTDSNFQLLEFLDAIKDIKKISDCSVSKAVLILGNYLKSFDDKKVQELVKYAFYYPPRVRAIVGSMLEVQNFGIDLKRLKESLNPLTTFELNLTETELTTIKNWNIV